MEKQNIIELKTIETYRKNKNNEKVLNKIYSIKNKYSNLHQIYLTIVNDKKYKILYSKGHVSDVNGMFFPEKQLLFHTIPMHKGKITKNNNYDFKYYFDKEDKIVLMERYYETSNNQCEVECTLYFYENEEIYILIYKPSFKEYIEIRYISYVNGIISNYVEYYHYTLEETYREYIYRFDKNNLEVIRNSYEGKPNELGIGNTKIDKYSKQELKRYHKKFEYISDNFN